MACADASSSAFLDDTHRHRARDEADVEQQRAAWNVELQRCRAALDERARPSRARAESARGSAQSSALLLVLERRTPPERRADSSSPRAAAGAALGVSARPRARDQPRRARRRGALASPRRRLHASLVSSSPGSGRRRPARARTTRGCGAHAAVAPRRRKRGAPRGGPRRPARAAARENHMVRFTRSHAGTPGGRRDASDAGLMRAPPPTALDGSTGPPAPRRRAVRVERASGASADPASAQKPADAVFAYFARLAEPRALDAPGVAGDRSASRRGDRRRRGGRRRRRSARLARGARAVRVRRPPDGAFAGPRAVLGRAARSFGRRATRSRGAVAEKARDDAPARDGTGRTPSGKFLAEQENLSDDRQPAPLAPRSSRAFPPAARDADRRGMPEAETSAPLGSLLGALDLSRRGPRAALRPRGRARTARGPNYELQERAGGARRKRRLNLRASAAFGSPGGADARRDRGRERRERRRA